MARKHDAMMIAQPKPTQGVGAVVRLALAASVAVFVAGLALTTAAGYNPRDTWQVLVTLAAFPWAILALLLLTALYRQATALCGTGDTWGAMQTEEPQPEPRESVRLVPVNRYTGPTVEGIEPSDLAYFVATITRTGDWTQRAWRGKRLPSGKHCDNTTHKQMTALLSRCGVLEGHGARTTGQLATRDTGAILSRLGLNN